MARRGKRVGIGTRKNHKVRATKRIKKRGTRKPQINKTKKIVAVDIPSAKALEEIKEQSVKAIESEILENNETNEADEHEGDSHEKTHGHTKDMLERIMFRLPCVNNPLVGTPKQVRIELDSLAKKMQRHPRNDAIFDKIHLYMHGYLINVVLKKFPFICGLQTVDVYQETLIALRFKAIPNFKYGKGMSFLNFAKMCIRRHLITLLNVSKNRKKDQSINQAISLDNSPVREEEDENKTTYANIIADNKAPCDKVIETSEAYEVTKTALMNALSEFERVVLSEYLSSSSYHEISKNITKTLRQRYNTKSIDNALLRIRKKAIHLMRYSKKEDLPIFLPKKATHTV